MTFTTFGLKRIIIFQEQNAFLSGLYFELTNCLWTRPLAVQQIQKSNFCFIWHSHRLKFKIWSPVYEHVLLNHKYFIFVSDYEL